MKFSLQLNVRTSSQTFVDVTNFNADIVPPSNSKVLFAVSNFNE